METLTCYDRILGQRSFVRFFWAVCRPATSAPQAPQHNRLAHKHASTRETEARAALGSPALTRWQLRLAIAFLRFFSQEAGHGIFRPICFCAALAPDAFRQNFGKKSGFNPKIYYRIISNETLEMVPCLIKVI